jgi:hypothetical protein
MIGANDKTWGELEPHSQLLRNQLALLSSGKDHVVFCVSINSYYLTLSYSFIKPRLNQQTSHLQSSIQLFVSPNVLYHNTQPDI